VSHCFNFIDFLLPQSVIDFAYAFILCCSYCQRVRSANIRNAWTTRWKYIYRFDIILSRLLIFCLCEVRSPKELGGPSNGSTSLHQHTIDHLRLALASSHGDNDVTCDGNDFIYLRLLDLIIHYSRLHHAPAITLIIVDQLKKTRSFRVGWIYTAYQHHVLRLSGSSGWAGSQHHAPFNKIIVQLMSYHRSDANFQTKTVVFFLTRKSSGEIHLLILTYRHHVYPIYLQCNELHSAMCLADNTSPDNIKRKVLINTTHKINIENTYKTV